MFDLKEAETNEFEMDDNDPKCPFCATDLISFSDQSLLSKILNNQKQMWLCVQCEKTFEAIE